MLTSLARDEDHPCQLLLPNSCTPEGLLGSCQPWLPCPHLQMLSRPISSSFAATLGRGCAGVSMVTLPPECVRVLSASSPGPHQLALSQKRLLISLSKALTKCRRGYTVGAVFRGCPAALATSEHRNVHCWHPSLDSMYLCGSPPS